MIFTPNIDVKRRGGPYCGPTAISILTGEPITRIEKIIRKIRRGGYRDSTGRKIAIRGTHRWEVKRVLWALGCDVEPFMRRGLAGQTLSNVVEDWLPPTGAFLVLVTGHFMVASGGKVADTTHREPVEIASYRRRRRRVEAVWKVVSPAARKAKRDAKAANAVLDQGDVREVVDRGTDPEAQAEAEVRAVPTPTALEALPEM